MKTIKSAHHLFDLRRPLWYGAFRPFFFLGAVFAVITLLLWPFLFFDGFFIPGQIRQMTIVQGHGYQLLDGFILAALCGFILTAIPEFTDGPFLSKRNSMILVFTWIVGRIVFYLPGTIFSVILAATDISLLIVLLTFVIRQLDKTAWSKYYDFVIGLLLLFLSITGYHYSVISDIAAIDWLRAIAGCWVILIIAALSRISMRIVNEALEDINSEKRYLSRPPRRHFAMVCVFLYSVAELLHQSPAMTGWLALAAAASVLNLLNDWHLERVVFRKWVLSLYTIYLLMGVSYGIIGISKLFTLAPEIESAGRHIMFLGSIGVSVFMVFAIAGRSHAGELLDERLWVPVGVGLLVAAAFTRFLFGFTANHFVFWLSVLCWLFAYGLNIRFLSPVLFGPRPDNRTDASGRTEEGDEAKGI